MKTSFRRFYVLMALCLFAVITAQAKPITREQARQRAEKFLLACPGSKILSPVQNRAKLAPRRGKAVTTDETELYYVFNRGTSQGYVIVSGDDETLPVLGYTEDGEFDYTQIPDNMRSWLDGYEQELRYISEHPESVAKAPKRVETHAAVAPMIKTNWNQGSPYNDSCPNYFSLGRSVTGCVATAMAQLLYYQRDKSVTETQAAMPAYDAYTEHATYGHLHVDGIPAGSPIDWDNMLESYGSSASAKQKKAVADLMHYCGVSVYMDYTNNSSGAQSYLVADAMKNYFGYGSSVRYVSQSSYSEDAWDALIYAEMAQGRPCYLSGANSEGGHAFVCCGYDGNRCYYINWGWGGMSNGYFLLTSLNPSSQGIGGSGDGYNQYRDAVIGIEPENYGEKAMPFANAAAKNLCVSHFDTNGDGVFSYGEAASVTDLGTVFKGSRIATFDELYYFTGLTELSDSAFSGCTSLTSVRLPKALTSIGKASFEKCSKLKTLSLSDGVTSIGDGAFADCRVLTNLTLPYGLSRIGAHAFQNCIAFTELTLPGSVSTISDEAYSGCTKLQTVNVKTLRPQDITLGTSVFDGISLATATLNIPQGTKDYFDAADQWKDFGKIVQERNLAQGKFLSLETNKDIYLYNLGTGRYLTKGEAWTTQAVVAETDEPMRFQLRRSTSMPEGVYYLYSDDTGNSRHYLFRTSEDESVGMGVNACFVDRENITADSYWKVTELGDKVYTFQIPSNQTGYVKNQFWGVQPSHASNAATPTYGAYSDVSYDDYAKNCQWMFVEYDADRSAIYRAAKVLGNLLITANKKKLDTEQEQAVYDNFDSDLASIRHAQSRLRKKLNYIDFEDNNVFALATGTWDVDGNGEISYSEANSAVEIGSVFKDNKTITTFDELQYFTNVTALSGNCFQNCTNLTSITLPASLGIIQYRAFMGCSKLASITLSEHVFFIGENAFTSCTGLKEVHLGSPDPASINVKSTSFPLTIARKATLYVPQGSKELYEAAAVWKNFGSIEEERSVTMPEYSSIATGEKFYVMNLGTRRFLNKGEAYGSQSIVAIQGQQYELRRTNSMPDSVYYLYYNEAGTNKILFRTNSDTKVGKGVKACFTDGASVSSKAYWKVTEIGDHIYTLQVPTSDAEYVEGQYLGVLPVYHDSDFAYPTFGNYYDIIYKGSENYCQWVFISVDEMDAAKAYNTHLQTLALLIQRAEGQQLDVEAEKAVYADMTSTTEQVEDAIVSLRAKLHYIDFCDSRTRTICLNAWDDNNDDELTLEEAAAVTDLGMRFSSVSAIHSVDELRYFTGLTTLPATAFRRCTGLVSAYAPSGVATIGENAFEGASALKYIALLNPNQVVSAADAALPKSLTVFVPASQVEAYQTDEIWGTHTIQEYTGIPTVVPDSASRQYGRSNPTKYTYAVLGAPINGEPVFTAEAEATSPVGEYAVKGETGTNTSFGFMALDGVLTVEPAPLTITAKSYTRNIGEENPEFEVTYRSFRNRENYEVLLKQPTVECDATPESPSGTYEIRVYGAEAQNYEISYVSGTLTIIDPDGICGLDASAASLPVYDLQGRCVGDSHALRRLPKGIYVVGGQKFTVR